MSDLGYAPEVVGGPVFADVYAVAGSGFVAAPVEEGLVVEADPVVVSRCGGFRLVWRVGVDDCSGGYVELSVVVFEDVQADDAGGYTVADAAVVYAVDAV